MTSKVLQFLPPAARIRYFPHILLQYRPASGTIDLSHNTAGSLTCDRFVFVLRGSEKYAVPPAKGNRQRDCGNSRLSPAAVGKNGGAGRRLAGGLPEDLWRYLCRPVRQQQAGPAGGGLRRSGGAAAAVLLHPDLLQPSHQDPAGGRPPRAPRRRGRLPDRPHSGRIHRAVRRVRLRRGRLVLLAGFRAGKRLCSGAGPYPRRCGPL